MDKKLKIANKRVKEYPGRKIVKPLLKKGIKQSQDRSLLNERGFVKNVMNKAKTFVKDSLADIRRNAKNIIKSFKRDYMSTKQPTSFKPGKMLAMNYNAKDVTKKFDKTPLIICIGPPKNKKLQKTHTLGLNLHWLPAKDRVKVAQFFVDLLTKRNNELRYEDVLPFMYKFKGSPVLRMYIIKNIGPKVIDMPKEQFLTAAAIPSEKWS